jgi:putative CocE/NonD family hydrolase
MDLHDIQLRWFDYWLKGIDSGVMEEPPIRLFVMGINQWRDEYEWPLARTRYTPYYLHSHGKANSLHGDGTLSPDVPGEEPADHYRYDPADPVPTCGGNTLMIPVGVKDQREVETRPDVLVYTGDPLEKPLEVTGPLQVVLYASSSAPDTDFTAKLVDVRPDGYAQNIADGILRARYHESFSTPKLLSKDEVYEFTIDLWATSHVFLPGHRLRVEISSSNFPRFDRNLNTGGDQATGTHFQVAEQAIFHNQQFRSHILLPVIP